VLHFHGIFLEQDLMRIFDDKSMGEGMGFFYSPTIWRYLAM
jgi:hypothetical protein